MITSVMVLFKTTGVTFVV